MIDASAYTDWRVCAERHSLARYRPIAIAFQAGLLLVGSLFWLEANFRGESFSESVYGSLAYQIPAEVWSGVMMLAAAWCWIGLIKPVNLHRVFWGAVLHSIAFSAITISAIFYDGEFAIGVFSSVFFVTPNLILAWKAHDTQ